MDQEMIENKAIPAPELDEASACLREQLAECQAAIRRCFDISKGDHVVPFQWDDMKIATRLMQASASAACALKRLKGTESRHTVRVEQGEGETPPPKNRKQIVVVADERTTTRPRRAAQQPQRLEDRFSFRANACAACRGASQIAENQSGCRDGAALILPRLRPPTLKLRWPCVIPGPPKPWRRWGEVARAERA
jgi:hypothetical protein